MSREELLLSELAHVPLDQLLWLALDLVADRDAYLQRWPLTEAERAALRETGGGR